MPFPVGEVANYILDLADRDDVAVSPMKLQKLVYLAHGWYLGIVEEPLIDEVVEAWQFGPVVPSLYHEFKRFGSGRIVGDRFTRARMTPAGKWKLERCELPDDTEEASRARELIDRVWDVYKGYSAVQLSNLTHQDGTPWSETWKAMDVKRKGKDIDDTKIQAHFKQLSGA
jgi:uncharacterized phage-associated protein